VDRRDITLVHQAVRERWPIPQSVREGLVDRMWAIVESAKSPRSRVMAARVIEMLDRQILQTERDLPTPPSPPSTLGLPATALAQQVTVHVHGPASNGTVRMSPAAEALADRALAEEAARETDCQVNTLDPFEVTV